MSQSNAADEVLRHWSAVASGCASVASPVAELVGSLDSDQVKAIRSTSTLAAAVEHRGALEIPWLAMVTRVA